MIWLQLALSSIVVVLAAIKLADYGDVIALRTRLGGMFIGTLLLAGATSLPELLGSISALGQTLPNMAAGNLLGSNMFNMFLLALLDILAGKTRILRRTARKHALSASLAILLTLLVSLSLLSGVHVGVSWVGWDSVILILAYVAGVRLIYGDSGSNPAPAAEIDDQRVPTLRRAAIGFGLSAAALVLTMPWLVRSSAAIADLLGITTGFIGTTLLAFVTSLPEFVACFAAVRLGAYDLAVGNLFGSNIFNMFAVGLVDLVYLRGHFLAEVDPAFALVGILGAILTALGLIGNLANVRRRLFFVEIDALVIIALYLAGLWLLYVRGIGA